MSDQAAIAPALTRAAFPFDNTFFRDLPGFYVARRPNPVRAPKLLFLNAPLAGELGLDLSSLDQAGLAAMAAMSMASPALADSITFDSSDIGTAYTLNYNGFSGGTTIDGLTGSTTFTLTGISGNNYTLDYSVANTSSDPVT